ncbi:MAG: V-type ATP synthase subunit I [Gammaproteobacteria bacterium]
MAIVRLKKVTFCGLIGDKVGILKKLQHLGGLHLIPLEKTRATLEAVTPDNAQNVVEALKYLHRCANKRHQSKASEQFDLDRVTEEVLAVKARIREYTDRHDALSKRIKEIEPWGDFSLPEPEQLAGHRLWFYIVPKRLMHKLKGIDLIWQTVYQDNLYCYVVVVSETEPPESAMPVARTHTGRIPLSELKSQYNQVELTLEDLQAERESLTRWITLMTLHFAEAQDKADLNRAEAMTLDQAGVFAVQGWLPAHEVERFHQFALHNNLALLIEDPAADDNPPTLLENDPRWAGGEDVIGFYQTPGYRGWDPSVAVFFSFTLFFAMILSDAGYAALFGLLLALRWRRFGKSAKGRRLRILAATTVGVSLLWGVVCGGYFGYTPPAHTLPGAVMLVDINDFDGMMRLSIAVGVLHIALANTILARQRRYSSLALAPLGWAWLVLGGFGFWLGRMQAVALLRDTGLAMMIVGGLCLLLFTSDRPVARATDWLWRVLDGVKSLVGITQLFGDVLSYMRLFALGLASASLALTFNQLAGQVYGAIPGLGLLFGILILVIGHTLNLVLCLMSGVVHGLRLNFIEFYNWSVSDEGYPFKAFSKKGVN